MPKSNDTACKILKERFGKDSLLGLATISDGMPQVRTVDAYYEDGAFYVVTHALSGKMRQIEQNPAVALCGDWFTAHGTGIALREHGNGRFTAENFTCLRLAQGDKAAVIENIIRRKQEKKCEYGKSLLYGKKSKLHSITLGYFLKKSAKYATKKEIIQY